MSNWHDRRYTDAHWDHERDLRKHEPRPGDRGFTDSDVLGKYTGPTDIPLRLQPKPLSTAMDVAILVRALGNIEDAAALIETFVDAKAAEQRLDAVAAGARP
jgi:hypothetical protein